MRRTLAICITGAVLACACGAGSGGGTAEQSSSEVTPPLPVSWTEGTWFVDPANVSRQASDGNACTTAALPCLTYAGVTKLWGTSSPRLRQNTTITFLSSQWNNGDPVSFTPYIENGATVTLQGALGPAQQVAAGTLSVVAAKNRPAAQLLEVTLPAGAQPGQLVVDSTRGSRAWVYKYASGNSWLLSQPLVAADLKTPFPPEDDGWQTGDSFALYQPVTVNLDEVAPVVADAATAAGSANLNVYQLTLLDPTVGNSYQDQYGQTLTIGANTYFAETSLRKVVSTLAGSGAISTGFVNVDIDQILLGETPGPAFTLWAGQDRYGFTDVNGGLVDADFVMGPSLPNNGSACGLFGATIGTAFVDTYTLFIVYQNSQVGRAGENGVVWGGGSILISGSSTLQYPSQATATATFLQSGGLFLDAPGLGVDLGTVTTRPTACAVEPTGSGGWTCGIAVTPANLDLAVSAGGFGGDAVSPGGGSITNRGTY